MELEIACSPLRGRCCGVLCHTGHVMLDAKRMQEGFAPFSDLRGEVLWRMFCEIRALEACGCGGDV